MSKKMYDFLLPEDRFVLDMLLLKNDAEKISEFWHNYTMKHLIREMDNHTFLKMISNRELPHDKFRKWMFHRCGEWIEDMQPIYEDFRIHKLEFIDDSNQEKIEIHYFRGDSSPAVTYKKLYTPLPCVPFNYDILRSIGYE